MPASARPAPKTIDDQLTAFDLVTLLIDRGAAVDVPLKQQAQLRTKIDRGGDGVLGAGTTPLIRAAKSADVKVMQLLLDKGANPNAATRAGVSVVMMLTGLASKEDDMTGRTKTEPQVIQGIELLAKAGADLNALDGQGRTAVHGAALWGYTEAIRVLARHGAGLDVKDKRGWTPIDTALGRAGGLGFDGSVGPHNEETARVIQDLLGRAKASAWPYPRAGSAGV